MPLMVVNFLSINSESHEAVVYDLEVVYVTFYGVSPKNTALH